VRLSNLEVGIGTVRCGAVNVYNDGNLGFLTRALLAGLRSGVHNGWGNGMGDYICQKLGNSRAFAEFPERDRMGNLEV